MAMMYSTGDAVGSGDLWMQIGMCSIQTYTKSLQHFIDKVNGRQVTLRTGHDENLEPFTEEYLDDLMNCAEGIIDGSIEPTVYFREKPAMLPMAEQTLFTIRIRSWMQTSMS